MRRHRQAQHPSGNGSDWPSVSPGAETAGCYSSLASEFSAIAQRAIGHVACGLAFILCMSQCGIFDVVRTDTGPGHYAERPGAAWLPAWLPMPLNTAVNAGYILCGVCWFARVRRHYLAGHLPEHSAYLFCVFAAMATAYGPVQLARILGMTHGLAVIDQWVTLPFFAWVPIWVWSTAAGRLSPAGTLTVMVASLLSYLLAVVTDLGFELALTLHVAAAMGAGLFLCLYPGMAAPGLVRAVALAAVSCAGFVGLKLLDHELARVSDFFRVVSGHFVSKVADVLQIHFVCCAFESVVARDGAAGKRA